MVEEEEEKKSKDQFVKPKLTISSADNSNTNTNTNTTSTSTSRLRMPAVHTSTRFIPREKVALEPGHSALDWNELLETKGKKGELVTGMDIHLNDPEDDIYKINHIQIINQLKKGLPPYSVKPYIQVDSNMLKKHVTVDDCWTIINGKVYCITHYLEFHPGGASILKKCFGKNGTLDFNRYHRWVSSDKILDKCFIGYYIE